MRTDKANPLLTAVGYSFKLPSVVLSRQLGLELSVNVTQHECAGIHCITHTSDDALLVPYLHPALKPRHAMGIHGYETPPSPP